MTHNTAHQRKRATYRHLGPRWFRVAHPRNSTCGSARITDLDFSEWWTDGGSGSPWGLAYLKVPHKGGNGMEGTVHRVHCRYTDTPRLAMREGELYWLVPATDTEGEG